MTEHHHFVQHFLRPGDYVQTKFSCTAPTGAVCRQACKTCSDEQREVCECECLNEFGDERIPNLVDFGQCLKTLWLSEDAPEEMYNGERIPVRGPDPQPIEIVFTSYDECYWEYA